MDTDAGRYTFEIEPFAPHDMRGRGEHKLRIVSPYGDEKLRSASRFDLTTEELVSLYAAAGARLAEVRGEVVDLAAQGQLPEQEDPRWQAQVLGMLAIRPLGMSVLEIREVLARDGTVLPRESLQRQLVKVQGEGMIHLRDGRWFLAKGLLA